MNKGNSMKLLGVCLLLVLIGADKPSRQTVTIRDMSYSPATLRVSVGDTIVWKNLDDHDHTVTADDGSFKSGNIRSGSSFSHNFRKAGTYSYGCKYHPRMRGSVTVGE